ncbi:uncharacterized protein F4822DRAFT_390111 [Hypoxylon trugodes]|uniref:uncharacterized protein n=1 Tax=Hypoxylon trugodes TaxID=326681 RepID=UPI002198D4B2|nr:uncharacterized protein F4822DRAFT_390111 [Hypoxylon trugodes]KAI1392235.1 hypothetical protein F4822DRAFT_390111 [Hypoxylon trugodes]
MQLAMMQYKISSRPWLLALKGFNSPLASRTFSTSRCFSATNQIYTTVRRPDDLRTYQLLSSSSRTPLITLWTTSWCATCHVIAPLLKSVVESGVGEDEGGVGYCEVQFDAPDIMSDGLGMEYMITSIPTLLSFDAGEAQVLSKVIDGRKLAARHFLEEWIRNEARRHGGRGGGGSGVLGGLFKSWK